MVRNFTKSAGRYVLTDLSGLAFAALWGIRGLTGMGWSSRSCLISVGLITLPLAWGFITRDLNQNRPEVVHDHRLARHARRMRVILLFLAGMVLSMLHRPDLMLVAAGLVIGASYLPLGRAMQEPVHIFTGITILIVTLVSLFFTQPLHMIIAGLGTAFACWIGAAFRLARSMRQTLSPAPSVGNQAL